MMGENSRKLAVRRGWDRLVQRGPKLIAASNIQAYLPDAVASVDIGQQLQQQQVSEEEEGEEEEGEEAPSGTLSEGESEADSLSEEDASAADNPQSEVEASAAGSLSEEEAPGADTPQSKGEASATGSLQPEGVTAAGCLQSKGEAATGWLQFEGEAAMGSLSELKGCSPANARPPISAAILNASRPHAQLGPTVEAASTASLLRGCDEVGNSPLGGFTGRHNWCG